MNPPQDLPPVMPAQSESKRPDANQSQEPVQSGNDYSREFGQPSIENESLPKWLIWVMGIGIFWAGAYLFSFSGGFGSDVFEYQPKYGAQSLAASGPPDPKVLGGKLFSANCITCHQADGKGQAGQFPPLAGSEFTNGPDNRMIAIVLKGLQGPVTVEGQSFNNSMQAWEGQYTDEQVAAILTYERSAWGNKGPAVTPDAVKQVRDQFKDRKDQWTYEEIMKLPEKNLSGGQSASPASAGKSGAQPGASPAPKQTPANGSAPPGK